MDFLSSGGEFGPVLVNFRLSIAIHHKRNRFVELEMRAAVHGGVVLSIELEGDGHDGAGGGWAAFRVTMDLENLGIFEDGSVEINGLFGVAVEPQEWGDLLHVRLSPKCCVDSLTKCSLVSRTG